MTKIHISRRIFILVVVFYLSSSVLFTQTVQSGYFIETLPARLSLNPAFRPKQGYIGMPLLSNIYIAGKTNTFSLDKFIFPQNGSSPVTFMHPSVDADEFLSGIAENNYLDLDISYTLLSCGWYVGKGFWTVDMGVKAHADVNVPKDLFRLVKKGFRSDLSEPVRYNIRGLRVDVDSYTEMGVGYSRSLLNDALTVGVKTKLLLGIGNMSANIDELSFEAGEDQWIVRSKATLQGSAMGIHAKYDDNNKFEGFGLYNEKGFPFSGQGLGLDIGGVYKLEKFYGLNDLTFSLALTDVGFISWSKKSSIHMASRETEVIISGDKTFGFEGENSLEDYFGDIVDGLEEALEFQEQGSAQDGRTTFLTTRLNAGVEYDLLANRKVSVGIASSTYFNPSHTVTELTLAGNFRPLSWISSALTYSFIHSRFKTFGVAIHAAPKAGVNLFLASDYVIYHKNSDWLPVSSGGMNFQVGISFPLGTRRQ